MSVDNETRRRRRAEQIAAGECGSCGKPRQPPSRGGATATLCEACAASVRINDRNRRQRCIATGRCPGCGKPHNTRKPDHRKTIYCGGCLEKVRACNERAYRAKHPESGLRFIPVPTGEPRYRGGRARRLGPTRDIRIRINPPTLDAINVLKQRYRDANNGARCRDHVAEILRDAIASVLKKGGPIPVERERICGRGWAVTLSVPVAMYQQITHIATEKFGGSRALTVRVALRQAVNPPFVIATGGVRIPGGRRRDPWDYD